MIKKKGIAASDPNVPGATGIRPIPNHVAKISAIFFPTPDCLNKSIKSIIKRKKKATQYLWNWKKPSGVLGLEDFKIQKELDGN